MSRLSSWIIAFAAAAFVVVLAIIAAHNWIGIGTVGISPAGWIALVLGVLATLGVGIGLMALVFISNRRGYDEPPRGEE
jgi:ABC-type multidrug transport system permease subunit